MFILTTLKVEEVAVYLCQEHSFIEQRAYQHVSDGGARPEQAPYGGIPQPYGTARRALASPFSRMSWPSGQMRATQTYLHEEFILLRSKVLIPLFFEQEVVGFIAVGEKRSGDPFFNQDIEFLATDRPSGRRSVETEPAP